MPNKNLINIDENKSKAVTLASKLYSQGEIFIYPTDTIYGVGGNPFNISVIDKVNKLKSRVNKKQFILLINSVDILLNFVVLKEKSQLEFIQRIWPAPVSVIFNLNNDTSNRLKGKTAAFRIPKNQFCLDLLDKIKAPLISTSVNRSNKKPLSNHLRIIEKFGDEVNSIFFTKSKITSTASTLIDLTGKYPVLVREGRIKFVDLLQKFS